MVMCPLVVVRLYGRDPLALSHLWIPPTSTGKSKVTLVGLSKPHTQAVSALLCLLKEFPLIPEPRAEDNIMGGKWEVL